MTPSGWSFPRPKAQLRPPRLSSMLHAPAWRIGAETPRDGMSRAARKIRLVGMTERLDPRFVKLWTASTTSALGSGVTAAKQPTQAATVFGCVPRLDKLSVVDAIVALEGGCCNAIDKGARHMAQIRRLEQDGKGACHSVLPVMQNYAPMVADGPVVVTPNTQSPSPDYMIGPVRRVGFGLLRSVYLGEAARGLVR